MKLILKQFPVACFFKDTGRNPPNASPKVSQNASKTAETRFLKETGQFGYPISHLTPSEQKVINKIQKTFFLY